MEEEPTWELSETAARDFDYLARRFCVDIRGMERDDIEEKLRRELGKMGIRFPPGQGRSPSPPEAHHASASLGQGLSLSLVPVMSPQAPTPPGQGLASASLGQGLSPSLALPTPPGQGLASTSLGQGLSPSPVPSPLPIPAGWGLSRSPMPLSLPQAVPDPTFTDPMFTEADAQYVDRAMQADCGSQTRMWYKLPDNAGRFSFKPVSELDENNQWPQLFYPSLTRNNMRLIFENVSWGHPEAVLEPYTVLCRRPEQVYMPYCMLCHKFSDGYHRTSTKHRSNYEWWWPRLGTYWAMQWGYRKPLRYPAFV